MVDVLSVHNLHPDNWRNASITERWAALQGMENQQAQEQGRDPCTLIDHGGDPNCYGEYKHSDKTIIVHSNLFRSDDPRSAIGTIAHEGQHAYQFDCVYRSDAHPEVNPETKAEWSDNIDNYIRPDSDLGFKAYENQPIEVDANRTEENVLSQYDRFLEKARATSPNKIETSAPNLEESAQLQAVPHESEIKHDSSFSLSPDRQALIDDGLGIMPPDASSKVGNAHSFEASADSTPQQGMVRPDGVATISAERLAMLDDGQAAMPPPPPPAPEPAASQNESMGI